MPISMTVIRGQRLRAAAIVTSAGLLFAVTAKAHDFWLVPDAFAVAEGSSLHIRGQTSSRFPTSEAAVAVDRVADARLFAGTSEETITEMTKSGNSLLLSHRPATRGQRVVAVMLHPRLQRESATGFRRYLELEGAPEALARVDREGLLRGRDSVTRRYAKYAKTVVEVGRGGPRAFSRVVGHPLELVPLSDPSTLSVGDTLAVRILYRGGPLPGARADAGHVDAAAREPADSAGADLHVTADRAGVLRVPVRSRGLWNIRMIHIAQADADSGADWDAHWATLVFQVGTPGNPVAAAPPSGDSAAVATVVERFHEALANGDSAAAVSLLAADVTILESGGVETRAEYMSHHLPGDIAFARAIRSTRGPLRVTVQGDAAWVASTSTTVGTYRDRAINSAGAELMVLSKTAQGWRIRAVHWSSRARRPAPPPG